MDQKEASSTSNGRAGDGPLGRFNMLSPQEEEVKEGNRCLGGKEGEDRRKGRLMSKEGRVRKLKAQGNILGVRG